MARTNNEVIEKALNLIGVCGIGDTPEGSDYATTLVHLEDVLEAIDTRHRVGVDIPSDAIPEWAFLPIAKMVAGSVSLEYELAQFNPLYRAGLRNLRAHAANESRVNGRPVRVDYY